jgi:hypothetical protein
MASMTSQLGRDAAESSQSEHAVTEQSVGKAAHHAAIAVEVEVSRRPRL